MRFPLTSYDPTDTTALSRFTVLFALGAATRVVPWEVVAPFVVFLVILSAMLEATDFLRELVVTLDLPAELAADGALWTTDPLTLGARFTPTEPNPVRPTGGFGRQDARPDARFPLGDGSPFQVLSDLGLWFPVRLTVGGNAVLLARVHPFLNAAERTWEPQGDRFASDWFAADVFPALDAVMTRRQIATIRALASADSWPFLPATFTGCEILPDGRVALPADRATDDRAGMMAPLFVVDANQHAVARFPTEPAIENASPGLWQHPTDTLRPHAQLVTARVNLRRLAERATVQAQGEPSGGRPVG